MAATNRKMEDFLLKVQEEASNPASNLSVSLQPHFRKFYKRCPSSLLYRHRTFLIIAYIDVLRNDPDNIGQEVVNRIIKIHLDVCGYMMKIYPDEYWKFPLEDTLDVKLLRASVSILCNLSPKKHAEVIETLWCLTDSSNGLLSHICDQLQNRIESSPLIVLDWIEAFKLTAFKIKHMKNLLMSCLVNNIDISKYLMNDASTKDKALLMLDSLVEKKSIHLNQLEKKLFDKFSKNNLSTMAYKHARPNKFDKIPHTMKQRTVKNFIHNTATEKKISVDERRILALQTIEASKTSFEQVKEILQFIGRDNETLAIALGRIIKLSDAELTKIFHQYPDLTTSKMQEIKAELETILLLQTAPDFQRIGTIDCERFRCILVDDKESLNAVLEAMCVSVKRLVAFDVEASYVCQSASSSQEAALLQCAIGNTVYLVDIYSLKKKLSIFDWEAFFEVFLRPRIRRVGFGIKNDLNFLQYAFPFLAEFFERKKPKFFCVQDAVKMLANDPDCMKSVFEDVAPQLSLQWATKFFVGANLPKEEQSSNWCDRPLKEEKMIYAAQDAFYTLKCYQELQRRLTKEQWINLKKAVFCESEPLPATQSSSIEFSTPTKKKESFEFVVEHLKKICEEIKENNPKTRIADDVTIVLDTPFLKFVPLLRRCGFETWDHRDASPNPAKTARQMSKEMEYFLRNLKEPTSLNTFILTNKKTLVVSLSGFESSIITAAQEQCDSVVIEKIIRKTLVAIDFESIKNRCSGCRKQDSHAIIPMSAYRILLKSFAIWRCFDQKVTGLEPPLETFIAAFNSLSPEESGNCSIDGGEQLLLKNRGKTFRFSITGSDANLWVNKDKFTFCCDTKLFRSQRNEVKFCLDCKIFF